MMQFGERVSIFDYFDKFLKIQIRNGELVLEFTIRFAKILNEILESYKLDDQMCLVVYLSAFDRKMNYLLRDKEPKNLHQAFMIAIEIENNIKYGLTQSHFSINICRQDEMQRKNQCHIECLISDQQISTLGVVNSFVEDLEIKTCEHEISLLQRRNDSIRAELNAHVYGITKMNDRIDSFDELSR